MLAPHVTLAAADLAALQSRLLIPVPDAIFRVEGPGTMACLQGLLTSDVVKLTSGHAAWGAFLTAKGMIISDAWVVRDGESAWVLVPHGARETIAHLFIRTLPPRLARAVDRTGTMQLHWLCGGTLSAVDGGMLARPEGIAPFNALMLAAATGVPQAAPPDQSWVMAPTGHADALKLLLGWPTLDREIDDRTLPQEVRFDELGGVKYDKGCYTGQETVARLHFRGHANRALRGVRWAPGEGPTDVNVMLGEKAGGTLRTVARLGDEWFALAILRRDVAAGTTVQTGESEGVVTEPPFELGPPAVA